MQAGGIAGHLPFPNPAVTHHDTITRFQRGRQYKCAEGDDPNSARPCPPRSDWKQRGGQATGVCCSKPSLDPAVFSTGGGGHRCIVHKTPSFVSRAKASSQSRAPDVKASGARGVASHLLTRTLAVKGGGDMQIRCLASSSAQPATSSLGKKNLDDGWPAVRGSAPATNCAAPFRTHVDVLLYLLLQGPMACARLIGNLYRGG